MAELSDDDLDEADRLVALGGRALDPNAPGGPSVPLAMRLFREAWAALGDLPGDLVDRAARPDDPQALKAALDPTAAPSRQDARSCEAFLDRLVSFARGRRPSAARRAGETALLVALALLALFPLRTSALPSAAYWRASSAAPGWSNKGYLGQPERQGAPLVRTREQNDPSVLLVLGQTRYVRRVIVEAGAQAAARPATLALSARTEESGWMELGEEPLPSGTWVVDVGRPVAQLMLKARGRTALVFSGIEVQ